MALKTYLKEQRESDPLIVRDVSPLLLLVRTGLEHTGVGHLLPHLQRECPWDGVGRVDPAVEVKHVVRHIVGVNAVYGVADVLSGRDNDGECEKDDRANTPMKAKNRRIDVDVTDFHQCLQSNKYVQHGDGLRSVADG